MAMESFQPNYPSKEAIKQGEAHLTGQQGLASHSREEVLEYLRKSQVNLTHEALEEVIRTLEVKGNKTFFTLICKDGKKRNIEVRGLGDEAHLFVNGRDAKKFKNEFFNKYEDLIPSLRVMFRDQEGGVMRVESEKRNYERSEREALENDMREIL